MIFVTGDLHGEKEQIQEYIKVLSDCTKDDILIVAGDFGIPWYSRALDMHYKDDKLLDLLRNAPFTTCFVDGNHENFDLLYSNPVIENGAAVFMIWTVSTISCAAKFLPWKTKLFSPSAALPVWINNTERRAFHGGSKKTRHLKNNPMLLKT